jgi:hypothetical protein
MPGSCSISGCVLDSCSKLWDWLPRCAACGVQPLHKRERAEREVRCGACSERGLLDEADGGVSGDAARSEARGPGHYELQQSLLPYQRWAERIERKKKRKCTGQLKMTCQARLWRAVPAKEMEA